jgi:hypothetical protein
MKGYRKLPPGRNIASQEMAGYWNEPLLRTLQFFKR